ncbi:MAG: hypothetical protein PHG15_03815 [Acinetobacter sp.]|uniref:hypothetical protein n=1 Tax=Acinetobacter sp. TaxID=472 RepID=UPI00263139AF|nr:hypothetical protein [Acinetobacter sp.]MDD2944939.1 hypothetical protein [Acinetobacter sp.]
MSKLKQSMPKVIGTLEGVAKSRMSILLYFRGQCIKAGWSKKEILEVTIDVMVKEYSDLVSTVESYLSNK